MCVWFMCMFLLSFSRTAFSWPVSWHVWKVGRTLDQLWIWSRHVWPGVGATNCPGDHQLCTGYIMVTALALVTWHLSGQWPAKIHAWDKGLYACVRHVAVQRHAAVHKNVYILTWLRICWRCISHDIYSESSLLNTGYPHCHPSVWWPRFDLDTGGLHIKILV